MKTSALLQHILLALSLISLAIFNDFILSHFFTAPLNDKLNTSLIFCLYLIFFIWQSHLTTGKITLILIDLSIVLMVLFFGLHSITLILIFLVMIWLNRAVLYYSNALSIMADLALCGLSIFIAYELL